MTVENTECMFISLITKYLLLRNGNKILIRTSKDKSYFLSHLDIFSLHIYSQS